MQTKVINPYTKLGNKQNTSLDYIIGHLPVNPTFDDLNQQLTDAYFTPDPANPSPIDLSVEVIKMILANVYNGYVNGGTNDEGRVTNAFVKYNEAQSRIIGRMLKGIQNTPPEAMAEFLNGIEEEVCNGNLLYEEQSPLLVAAAMGKSASEYWLAQLATPGGWALYMNADMGINYSHIASWVSASMQGALLAYGLVRPPQVQLIDIFIAGIGATGLAAGKVVFGWMGK